MFNVVKPTDWDEVRKLKVGECDHNGTRVVNDGFGGTMAAYCFCSTCERKAKEARQ